MQLCIQDEQQLFTLEFQAWSVTEPARLPKLFSAAMLECGGSVLEQTQPRHGYLSFLVEFACERSMEIYAALVALGIHLSRQAHRSLTTLCQCARYGNCLKRRHIARIRITVQAVFVAESRAAGTAPRGE
ncbi:MAG TPA: hypothetical protein VMD29_02175 [Terracidiphilus sp.]|nr:hypothetical protein [Terracidiphilus sp.]